MLLELRQLRKAFGATLALRGVSFELCAGEVHVLAGENGAGKSTLLRIVAGALGDFDGEVRLDGHAVRLDSPAAARAAGIRAIHQELSLVPALSVSDNLLLGEPGAAFAPVRRRDARERARRALSRVELELDPDLPVETLSLAERQLVEIARALAGEPPVRVLVLDEPTSALTAPDATRLLALLGTLKTRGIGCIYCSHRLDEIFRVADRISVLRDGERVFTEAASALDPERLVAGMLGRTLSRASVAASPTERPVRLRAERLEHAGRPALRSVSLELARGELVGLAGVEGSGASTLLHALFGDASLARGTVEVDGVRYAPRGPAAALSAGVAFLAADRHASVIAAQSVVENATLSSLRRFSPGAILRPGLEHAAVSRESARVRLKSASLDAAAGALSGGNQQKVALLRCLLAEPRVLLLDDPTRGIDLGARADVHALLRELARTGTSILFRSTDLAELVELAERVVVLFDGRVVASLPRAELAAARLLALMMGAAA
jgi:ABC-type sugar transport system ATPase subunit